MARFPSIDAQGAFESPEVKDHIKDLITQDDVGITADYSVGERIFIGSTRIYSDTGWRILGTLDEDVASSGEIRIRRVNDSVQIALLNVLWNDATPGTNTLSNGPTIRSGFGMPDDNARSTIEISDSDMRFIDTLIPYIAAGRFWLRWFSRMSSSEFLTDPVTSTKPLSGFMSWTTNHPWPTSLPGSPA